MGIARRKVSLPKFWGRIKAMIQDDQEIFLEPFGNTDRLEEVMKKSAILVSALALAFSGVAFANPTPPPPPPSSHPAKANSDVVKVGVVHGNSVSATSGNGLNNSETNVGSDATINGQAFENVTGVASANQNSGANGLLQNQTQVQVNAVSGDIDAKMKSVDLGLVHGNQIRVSTYGAQTNYDGNAYLGDNAFANAAGIISLNQNSGANSLLDNQTSVQVNELSPCANGTCFTGKVDLLSLQGGAVLGNTVDISADPGYNYYGQNGLTNYNANATINGNTFSGASGIISANQNSGANSLLQNQTNVQVSQVGSSSGNAFGALGGVVAGNALQVSATGNPCNPCAFTQANYAANATIGGNAFQHASGVIALNQNTGANSMLQNQTSIQVNN